VAYVIAEPCIDRMDQSCVAVCPVDAIHSDPAVDRKFYIDPRECIDCGACLTECKQQAIYALGDLPTAWSIYARIDDMWQSDPDAARDAIEEFLAA